MYNIVVRITFFFLILLSLIELLNYSSFKEAQRVNVVYIDTFRSADIYDISKIFDSALFATTKYATDILFYYNIIPVYIYTKHWVFENGPEDIPSTAFYRRKF